MSTTPFYRWFPADYAVKTADLTELEDLMYRRTIDYVMQTVKGPLPFGSPQDEQRTLNAIRAFTPDAVAAARYVLNRFFPLGDDGMRHNDRCDEELAYRVDRVAKATESSAIAVAKRRAAAAARRAAESSRTPAQVASTSATSSGVMLPNCRSSSNDEPNDVSDDIRGGHLIRTIPTEKKEPSEVSPPSRPSANAAGAAGNVDSFAMVEEEDPDAWRQEVDEADDGALDDPLPTDLLGAPTKDAEADRRRAVAARCPVQAIVALYHEAMPENPKCLVMTKARETHLRSLWRDQARLHGWTRQMDGIELIRSYFARCASSPFLTGRVKPRDDRPTFKATLDFLVRPESFAKVIEGQYHRAAK